MNNFNKIIAFKMLSERISAILWSFDMLNLKATSFEMRGHGITDEGVGDYWWGGRGLLMSWQRITDEGAADYWHRAGVGVTKAPFVNFPVSKIFDLAKVPVRLFISHNGRDSVPNHQPHDCLLNRLSRRRSKKTNIKDPCHWPLCAEFTGDRRKCFHLMTSSWGVVVVVVVAAR